MLLKEWKSTDVDGTDVKDPELWLEFVEGLCLLLLLCSPSPSVRCVAMAALHVFYI